MKPLPRYLAAGVMAGLVLGCSDRNTLTEPEPMAKLALSASVAGTPISTLVVEVTASDIPTPLVFNIEIVNGTASGTITLPAGSGRTITVRAFESGGVETHRGSITVSVHAGDNPPVTIRLLPLTGGQPITVTLSNVVVTVTPASYTMNRGQTLELVAAITDAAGNPVAGGVTWATSNPARATVTPAGLVTADQSGSVQVVATYAGIAGAVAIEVVTENESVSAGLRHSCGVLGNGAAYCWGSNAYGQLGDETTTDRTSPVLVSGGFTFAAVSAGGVHTCGLTTGGAAYCWGDNSLGQLGDGTTANRTAPVLVEGGLSFRAVRAGYSHTCGVTTGGAAYCWGQNQAGQLGDGTTTGQMSPVAVSGGHTFVAVTAGRFHTCGVTADGAAYCWGLNYWGQLGNGGRPVNQSSPAPLLGTRSFAAVSAGDGHSCGIAANGAAYCWGSNAYGELGDGTTTSWDSPIAVSGGLAFVALNTTLTHTCAVIAGGAAYCWGSNRYGQLGDQTTVDRSSPVPVLGGLNFIAVGAGGGHSCGVTTGGAAYCWGYNGYGRLGDGTTTDRTTPVAVVGGLVFP